jgi:hypothetical protein
MKRKFLAINMALLCMSTFLAAPERAEAQLSVEIEE